MKKARVHELKRCENNKKNAKKVKILNMSMIMPRQLVKVKSFENSADTAKKLEFIVSCECAKYEMNEVGHTFGRLRTLGRRRASERWRDDFSWNTRTMSHI